MDFMRRHSGWVSILAGVAVFAGLSYLTGWLLGPATCRDGWHSSSIGSRGACSWHGGVDRSRSGLGFIWLIAAGASGAWLFDKLNPKPAYRKPNPILHQRCPRCGGPMHYSRQEGATARCNRYPVCSGEKPMDGIGEKPLVVPDGACPQCASPMRLRTARKGRHPGRQFWGCSKYPRCRGTRPFDHPTIR